MEESKDTPINVMELLSQAENAYLEQDYSSAAATYDQLHELETDNPYLLINGANSYLQNQEFGEAIYRYYQAKSIVPRDKELNHNLAIALTRTEFSQPPLVSYSYMNLTEAFIIVLVLNIVFLFRKRIFQKKNLRYIFSVFFLLAALNFAFISFEQKIEKHGVVARLEAEAYSGDDQAYTKLFTIYDGQIVEIIRQEGAWSQIKHAGNLGWVETATLKVF